MAEVVSHSTQHLPGADLRAIAVYLQTLPVLPAAAPSGFPPATAVDPRP
jgi:hypothetical protein